MLCCPGTQENPCLICPNGITSGDDYAPFIDDGDTSTCKEMVDSTALFFSEGDESCEGSKMMQAYCCPTVNENSCILCPNGITNGDDYTPFIEEGDIGTCRELVDVTAMLLSEGDESCDGSKIMQAYCCPDAEENPCLICPNGLSVEKEDIIFDGDSLTCKVSYYFVCT